jgi:pyrimidine operon attenuation protein/uracil phosphoribosyltransferase
MALPDAEALLAALAEQIRRDAGSSIALVGIYTGGVWIAERLHRILGLSTPVGTIDVAFWRDDYKKTGLRPGVKPSDIPFKVEGADIILVDDVLYTGRTIRAAMNEIFDYGRPTSIRLAALVDRGGRQLPICPQYLGAAVEVERDRTIELRRDGDERLSLWLAPPAR